MRFEDNFGPDYFESMSTVAAAIVQVLRFYECKDIFGVPGDYAAPLVLALDEAFELCPAGNEMQAGFSACGAAELGDVGVCLVTYTVGSLPIVTAAALAQTECLPVVFISGAPGEAELHSDALHHTLSRPDSWDVDFDSALKAFAALGVRSERLQGARNSSQPGIAGKQFYKLVRHAYTTRQPVFIEVPRDLLGQVTQTLALPSALRDLPSTASNLSGLGAIVDYVAAKLIKSERPMLFLGAKIKLNSKLQRLIIEFCEKLKIPFAVNLFAKGVFGEDHPLFLGTYNGVFSEDYTREYIESKTDFILEIGTSTIPMDLSDALGTGTQFVETFENRVCLKGTERLEADLIELFDKLQGLELEAKEKPEFERDVLAMVASNTTISYRNIYETISAVQAECDQALILLTEVGGAFFASFTARTKTSELGRSWLSNPWYGAMGTTLPYARALCRTLRRRDQKDVPLIVIGDGGFSFQSNELIHFQREKLDVVILYLSNLSFFFGKCCESPIYEVASPDFRLEKLVEAYGGHCARAKHSGDLHRELGRAVVAGGIQVIEVALDMESKPQHRVIELINTYIQAKAGEPEAVAHWQKVVERVE
ncbi:MAG: thiamine pyrophosphate-binding protein [Myxococcales bacterium]|nr:thiamine pyrophosphate-binding protein [Myxococcales bacterium]